MDPSLRKQLVSGVGAVALLVCLGALAAVAAVHLSTHTADAAVTSFETRLADVRAVRHAARDLRAAGRGYLSSGDRLATVGARTILTSAVDRLHGARMAGIARDARALSDAVETLTRDRTDDLAGFDTDIDRRTRALDASSDAFIASEHTRLRAQLESVTRTARRAEVTSIVLALIALAALFGSVATFLRAATTGHGPTLSQASSGDETSDQPQPKVLT